MGYLVYDGEVVDEFEDRFLAHLQIVIVNKFRRHEEFSFSWRESAKAGDGRGAIWLSPSIGVRFRFAGSRAPDINLTWLGALYEAAASGRGLYPVEEPGADPTTTLPGDDGAAVSWAVERTRGRSRAARPPSN